ncbi:alpha/beta fold hydrolase [Rathayibacter sp. AY1D9]|uniref:alpha/beta fold hydrolase n=1 Tax=Rathayibacter sp. AY1D9 TaxID=2080548 RepID=UPI000CE7F346|nr:alpha/beta hydrolase [Rathayibacter sp. AY1D9]PPH77622.1 alpha/beta hydrolase [Rathayibacter sp. AY1D9]
MTGRAATSRHEFRVDSRTLVAHDFLGTRAPRAVVVWCGGTPHTGALLAPHVDAAAARGIRLVSVARPGFGGSMRTPGRSIADAAADVLRVADLLGIKRFVVTGYSGGGPHALAAGALGGDRVLGVATFGSPAPFSDDGAWFDGMQDPGALRSARDGRAAREEWEETARFDPEQFTGDDYSALDGPLTALGAEAGRASELEQGGSVDDDLALVMPWGVDLSRLAAPVLLLHGAADRVVPVAHAERIRRLHPAAELTIRPGRGHIGVLLDWPDVLDRLLADGFPGDRSGSGG